MCSKKQAESGGAEKQSPHRNIPENIRLDLPLKCLCIGLNQCWECARFALHTSQVGGCLHRGEQDVRGPAVCLAWAEAAEGGGREREQEQEIQLSGVSWLCSSFCSSLWLQSFGSGSKTCFA